MSLDYDFTTDRIIPSSGNLTITATGALYIPTGTTAERPVSPNAGYIRYNTTLNALEFYNAVAVAWQTSGNPETNGIANLTGTGLVVKTGTGTYTSRTLTGTTNTITITNGDGVAGNPTVTIASNPVLPGLGSVTVPIGATGDRPGSPANGMMRYNTTLAKFEAYEAGAWTNMIGGGGGVVYGTGVRAGSTANITVASPGATIDGVTLAAGDRVLLKNQTAPAENGVYVWNGAATPMTRATDMDGWTEVPGVDIFVREGTVNEGTSWWNSSPVTGTIDVTPMSWTGNLRIGGDFNAGDSWTAARAASGSGPRVVGLIDTNAAVRIWRFNTGSTDPSIEFGYGTNDDLANAANSWWDTLLDGSQDSYTIRRRTGNVLEEKVWVGPTGTVAISNDWDLSVPAVGLVVNHTDAIQSASGTTAQRPGTPANGMVRYNSTVESFEAYVDGRWEPVGGNRGANTLFDDFLTDAVNTPISALGWDPLSSGTGTGGSDVTTGVDSTDRAIGVFQMTTGTTATGRYGISLGQAALLFGYASYYMEWRVEVPILSTAGQEYDLYIGFANNIGATGDVTDGAWFEYNRNNSTQWVCATANNSVRTRTASGTAVTAATWYRLGIEVNAAGSLVTYYINGAQVATINTNIPTGAGRQTGIGAKIEKSAGTTGRVVVIDYFKMLYFLTTPR